MINWISIRKEWTSLNNYYNTSFIPYYDGKQSFSPNNTYYNEQQMSYPINTYDTFNLYNYPYGLNMPANLSSNMQAYMQTNKPQAYSFSPMSNQYANTLQFTDYGPEPFSVNIEQETKQNNNFRTALWTGDHLQLTLMNINVGEDIGLEMHPDVDQFIRIEQGQGLVMMGDRRDMLDFQAYVEDDFAFIIPAGKWHNLINIGNIPIKLYSVYAPPNHPHGTVHRTKAEAEAAEH